MDRSHRTFRYLLVTVLFCALCVGYLGKLLSVQIGGRGEEEPTTRTRTVTLQATRGEIYDRNGIKLVANPNTYDIVFSYRTISRMSPFQRNDFYLLLFSALRQYGESETHTEEYFPLEGTYPNYRYLDEASDTDGRIADRFNRVLDRQGLKKNLSADKLVGYYVETNQLLAKGSGNSRLFSDEEVDLLLRLYYDMDAQYFSYYGEYVFASGVGMELMTAVVERFGTEQATFRHSTKREYLYPGVASHILGKVGPIFAEEWEEYRAQGYDMNAIVGKSGCELAFESYLRATDGEMKITEDEDGNVISTEVTKEAVNGRDVYLTIDLNLQIAAEEGVAATVAEVQRVEGTSSVFYCDAGAAVVMDPDTFRVLAIASYPTYDLETFNSDYSDLRADPANPLLNRALQGVYAPGSTFKPGLAVTGLEEKVITAETEFFCNKENGKYSYPESTTDHPKCSTYQYHTDSYLTVREAIQDSCNSYFYELGRQLGIDRMEAWMSKFGFGQKTGIELGEAAGTLAGKNYRRDKDYSLGEVIRVAIGQSDTQATPIQLCSYMATLYNGGTRRTAHLLDHVTELGKKDAVVWDDSEQAGSRIGSVQISEATYATVMDGMRDMVTGTKYTRDRLSGLGLDAVFGKTGTAEVWKSYTDENGEQKTNENANGLFICGAEYRGQKLVASFVAENVGEEGHGYYNAVAARSVLSAWKKQIDSVAETEENS